MSPKTSAITISLRRHYPYQVQWFPLASDLSLSAPTIYSCWYHYIRPAPPCQAICANTAAHEPPDRTCYLRSLPNLLIIQPLPTHIARTIFTNFTNHILSIFFSYIHATNFFNCAKKSIRINLA